MTTKHTPATPLPWRDMRSFDEWYRREGHWVYESRREALLSWDDIALLRELGEAE